MNRLPSHCGVFLRNIHVRAIWRGVVVLVASTSLLVAGLAPSAAQRQTSQGNSGGGGGFATGLAIGLVGQLAKEALRAKAEQEAASKRKKSRKATGAKSQSPKIGRAAAQKSNRGTGAAGTSKKKPESKAGRVVGNDRGPRKPDRTNADQAVSTGHTKTGPIKPVRTTPDRPQPERSQPGRGTVDVTPPDHGRPPKVDIACIGGRIVRGDCRCPAGSMARAVGGVGQFCGLVLVDGGGRGAGGRDKPPSAPPTVRPRGDTAGPPLVMLPPTGPPQPPLRRGSAPPPPIRPSALPPADAIVPDEVLVEIEQGAPATTEADVAQTFQLTLVETSVLDAIGLRLARYRIPDSRGVPQVVASLAGDARVQGPQPNYLYNPQGAAGSVQDASFAALQYGLRRIAATAAQRQATGRGVVVAVIDTGIDAGHPDLADAVAATFDATLVTSKDAASQAAAANPRAGRATRHSSAHATAIAGIIAARGLARGIAPQVRLLNAKAFAGDDADHLRATSHWLLKSLDWSIARGARIVNMSLAGPREDLLQRAVETARAKDIIVVAAAGNGGPTAPPAYPAAYRGVIAVTATDADDRLYTRANLGDYIALAAPGVDIFTLAPDAAHDVQTGTSMAAAHVSGMIALLLEWRPDLSIDAVRQAVMDTAEDLGRPGRDAEFGAGLGNAEAALAIVAKVARSGHP